MKAIEVDGVISRLLDPERTVIAEMTFQRSLWRRTAVDTGGPALDPTSTRVAALLDQLVGHPAHRPLGVANRGPADVTPHVPPTVISREGLLTQRLPPDFWVTEFENFVMHHGGGD